MSSNVYERLADALGRLPNGFARTPSNVECVMLELMYTEEEAALASLMTEHLESADIIAERAGLSARKVRLQLINMAKKHLVWLDTCEFSIDYDHEKLINSENPLFRLPPFIIGLLENYMDVHGDHEFVHLFEAYMADGGAVGIMKPSPSIHRVIPSQDTVKREWVLPYDDVKNILLKANTFHIYDCTCRSIKDRVGRKCDFPVQNCLYFSSIDHAHDDDPDYCKVSREDALKILNEAETLGLVHTVSNVMKGVGYICNCCGCCCTILRGINEWGIENSVAAANYYSVIDGEVCTQCGICVDRCQVNAISDDKVSVPLVDLKKCIGCGLCVSGCPVEAVKLIRKPEDDIIHPPEDFKNWESARKADND
ncbi:MAG: 4Fe-4S binding protein [Desulfobacterales bacterium]|nr:4Fe-4S binding protein [Desulfobacterales bacterium]